MASRKEEKERLRLERVAAERRESSQERKRLLLGYAVAAILGLAVVGGIVFALTSGGSEAGDGVVDTDSENVNLTYGVLPEGLEVDEREGTPPPEIENGDLVGASTEASCELQQDLPSEGNTHFNDADKVVEYETNPPTSGDHFGSQTEAGSGALADGAFLETPNWNRLVHSLEHGRVLIQYSPDLPEEDQLALKGVFDADRAGVDLFPNAEMPYEVAATGWTQLLGCETYEGATTLDAIRAFTATYRGRGPEPVGF